MTKSSDVRRNSKVAFAALLLALFSCALGLFFCLAKSPQARGQAYLNLAVQALQENNETAAASAAFAAVSVDPANVKAWNILSSMLQQDGQMIASRQAAMIARKLQQNPGAADPVYAMPAELKLSLLAMDSPAGY